MHYFKIPQTFGDRQCDRLVIALLGNHPYDVSKETAVGMMFMVWRDFASGRSDRRMVPSSKLAMATCSETLIIETFAGWKGARGAFVEVCVNAGFFSLIPETAAESALVLADFFPANAPGNGPDWTASKIGGIRKGVRFAKETAVKSAKEQLDMFKAAKNPVLEQIGESALRDALLFIHQLCNILRREHPRSEFWRRELAAKTHAIKTSHLQPDIDLAFAWLAANRENPEIPTELDFILDAFPSYVENGRKVMG